MIDPIEVYRGLRLSPYNADRLLAKKPGTLLRASQHRWWARSRDAAIVYAKTAPPRGDAIPRVESVLITAHLWASFKLPSTTLLPDLQRLIGKGSPNKVLIRIVEVVRV